MNKSKTNEEVIELVKSCNDSGLSKKEYAKSAGLTTHQVYWYFRRFNRQINPEFENKKNRKTGFKKISLQNAIFKKDSITLRYGNLEIAIPENFNSENLKQIIETLEIDIHA